jgi:integrase
LQFVGQVYRYGVANQIAASDPTRDLRGALSSRKPKHLAAILEPKKAGGLLRAIDGYDGNSLTRIALQLSALIFVRPGELRRAEWAGVDLESAVWRIPGEKSKGRVEHAVPLARQATGLFDEVRCLTGDGRYVFP